MEIGEEVDRAVGENCVGPNLGNNTSADTKGKLRCEARKVSINSSGLGDWGSIAYLDGTILWAPRRY
jgi:hypothetical protein